MKKTKLVIASILKPVDDTRMYEKFGISLSQTNKYDINIIGFQSKNLPQSNGITFHPLFFFNRLSLKRIFAPFKIFFRMIKLTPKVLIVNTHELLLVSFLYKILFGGKLLYDVRENYYRNIRFTHTFPFIIRDLVAAYARGKEYLSYLFIDHYLLAEEGYRNEFTFIKNNYTIVENKYKPLSKPKFNRPKDKIRLLFTGTVAESTGILKAISLTIALHEIDERIELIIRGKCAFSQLRKKINKLCKDHDFISCDDLSTLTTHSEIEKAIATSNFGIIYYPHNISTINTKPTKLYEYLALQLPIILHDHKPWVDLASSYSAAIPIHFEDADIQYVYDNMITGNFYPNGIDNQVLWVEEEKKLLEAIDIVLKK